MDWAKAKSAFGTIAPWLAGTFGSPVAGIGVKVLCDVFGLAGDSATPENFINALATATPEKLQELRAAEMKHAEVMQSLGYANIEKLEQTAAADRDSARQREASVRDNTPKVLAALAVIVFLLLVGFVANGNAPAEGMREGFWMLAGAAIATFKDVYGYYFGSSAGSHGKDDTISRAIK